MILCCTWGASDLGGGCFFFPAGGANAMGVAGYLNAALYEMITRSGVPICT